MWNFEFIKMISNIVFFDIIRYNNIKFDNRYYVTDIIFRQILYSLLLRRGYDVCVSVVG